MADTIDQILKKHIDLKKYSDIHQYTRNLERAFCVMEVVQKEFGVDRLKTGHIAEILTEKFDIATSQQAINIALKRAKRGTVHKSKDGYKLMEKGRGELHALSLGKSTVILIEPGKPFTSKTIIFEKVFSNLSGEIKICDTYCGPRTLDILSRLDVNKRVFVLTQNIEDKPKGNFQRIFKDFKKERPNAEIKIYNNSELHDRYIIAKGEMWLVGHGLKDLGTKESFIIRMGKDIKDSMETIFDRRWKIASPLEDIWETP